MCELTTIMAVAGAASSGLSIAGQNAAISAQQRQVVESAQRAHAENAFRSNQEHRNALEDAHVSALERDRGVGRARVRNTSLGISGVTAGELVNEELRVGGYNVTSALESMRDVQGAQIMGTAHTASEARGRVRSLATQRVDPLSGLMSMAKGGLQGYSLGQRATAAFGTGTPWRRN